MSIEIKISKKRIPYKIAMRYINKRVEEVKKGTNRELFLNIDSNYSKYLLNNHDRPPI